MLALCFIAAACPYVCEARARVQANAAEQPERVEQLVAEGVKTFEAGDLKAAKDFFQRALKLNQNNVTALTYLGIIADREGDMIEAERRFAAAAIADPLSPAARNNHGAILLRLGRTAQAASQFETSLRLDKNQPSALINLAQIRFMTGTPEAQRAARSLFERARSIAPDIDITRALIIINLRLNDRAAATDNFREYAARITGSTAAAATPAARTELGAVLLEGGLVEEAIGELSAAVAADQSNVKAIVLLARAYFARKDIPAAGRTLEAAVARGVEAAPIYAALAEIYERSGHVENAIPAMRLAIQRDPKNESYRFRYGMLLTDTKAPGAAVIRLQEALKEFPNSARLWFALGVAQAALDKYDEAAKAFTRAIEIDPKFPPALSYLGMTHAQMGQYAEAIALYERALAVDEKIAVAHYLEADALLKQTPAELKRIEAHLLRALELDEAFTPARLALGKLYLRMQRWPDAATNLESVIAREPDLTEAHYQLGQVYKRLKRAADAERAFATFKRLNEGARQKSWNEQKEIAQRLANVRF